MEQLLTTLLCCTQLLLPMHCFQPPAPQALVMADPAAVIEIAQSAIAPALKPEPEPDPEHKNRVTAYPSSQPHKVTVLMYHHLVATEEEVQGNNMVVTAQRFASDLKWLEENGYTTVLPRDLVSGQPLPKKAVMISFDDGYESNYTLAFPLLKAFEQKAAIALIGEKIDSDIPGGLTWEMCREMADSGLVEFGSHTYSLHNLDERNGAYIPGSVNGVQRYPDESHEGFQARVLDDLQRSIDEIEQQLGTEVLYFAYPYGVKEPWATDFIASHFALTMLTREGVADLSKGFYSLPRKTVSMVRSVDQCFS